MAVPHPPEPANPFVFEPDNRAREGLRSLSACSYLVFVARHCPDGVGEAVMKKIEYRKSLKAPNHEFLLCFVEDRNVPTSSPSCFGRAIDVFTITCDINAKPSDIVLSTLTFDDDSGFTADEAAMICQIASDCADEYNALGHQCYWYAGVIYKIIQEIYLSRFKETLADSNRRRGMGRGVRIQTNIFILPSDAPELLAQIHRKRWPEWTMEIEVKKKENWSGEQRQELNRKDEVIKMLQRKLDELEMLQGELQ
ncbi:hypothetical protein ARMSODRAFT_1024490 [Armillaria solidipes]|uniref:Uncharacterized protein n=1 Tax=Armillaria solidipes TaxID=1076256 RepID=A0A2H3AW70_9AGAR|nr:hypothetical protein ARMSODRAFT_1024490 [Armillaria solidipes]